VMAFGPRGERTGYIIRYAANIFEIYDAEGFLVEIRDMKRLNFVEITRKTAYQDEKRPITKVEVKSKGKKFDGEESVEYTLAVFDMTATPTIVRVETNATDKKADFNGETFSNFGITPDSNGTVKWELLSNPKRVKLTDARDHIWMIDVDDDGRVTEVTWPETPVIDYSLVDETTDAGTQRSARLILYVTNTETHVVGWQQSRQKNTEGIITANPTTTQYEFDLWHNFTKRQTVKDVTDQPGKEDLVYTWALRDLSYNYMYATAWDLVGDVRAGKFDRLLKSSKLPEHTQETTFVYDWDGQGEREMLAPKDQDYVPHIGSVTNAEGEKTRFSEYGNAGQIEFHLHHRTSPPSELNDTMHEYDANADLTKSTNARSGYVKIVREGPGNKPLEHQTHFNAKVGIFHYWYSDSNNPLGTAGRLAFSSHDLNELDNDAYFNYDLFGHLKASTDYYDNSGAVGRNKKRLTQYSYTDNGLLREVTGPLPRPGFDAIDTKTPVTSYTYDKNSNLVTTAWNQARGSILEETRVDAPEEPNIKETRKYDSLNRQTRVERVRLDENGAVDSLGLKVWFYLDERGVPIVSKIFGSAEADNARALDRLTMIECDKIGRATALSTYPNGGGSLAFRSRIQYEYFSEGYKTRTFNPNFPDDNDAYWEVVQDCVFRTKETSTPPKTEDGGRVTAVLINTFADGLLRSSSLKQDGERYQTVYEYVDLELVHAVKMELRKLQTLLKPRWLTPKHMFYDRMGNLTREVDPRGVDTRYTMDEYSNVTAVEYMEVPPYE